MMVADLIGALQRMDPAAKVVVSVADPKDTAYTDDVDAEARDGECRISGWVASDNEGACAPWSLS